VRGHTSSSARYRRRMGPLSAAGSAPRAPGRATPGCGG
jgi:hypothetical protein